MRTNEEQQPFSSHWHQVYHPVTPASPLSFWVLCVKYTPGKEAVLLNGSHGWDYDMAFFQQNTLLWQWHCSFHRACAFATAVTKNSSYYLKEINWGVTMCTGHNFNSEPECQTSFQPMSSANSNPTLNWLHPPSPQNDSFLRWFLVIDTLFLHFIIFYWFSIWQFLSIPFIFIFFYVPSLYFSMLLEALFIPMFSKSLYSSILKSLSLLYFLSLYFVLSVRVEEGGGLDSNLSMSCFLSHICTELIKSPMSKKILEKVKWYTTI